MLNSLKQTGKNIGREIGRAWENLSEGWRELLSRSSEALTHFGRHKDEEKVEGGALSTFPRWSLLAGEVEETPRDIIVRLEIPGMDKEDCNITIEGNMLHLSGEKRIEREAHDSTYHVMERAYGAFQRSIPLPRNVNIDKAEARYSNGVLTVRLPKEGGGNSAKSVQVM
jgi:HSP20 family protein